MTITVLMTKTCVAGNGTFHTAGKTYSLDDAIAGAYLASKSASYVSGGPANEVPVTATTNPVTGRVSLSAGDFVATAALGLSVKNTWVGFGDSTMDVMGGPNKTGNANIDRASYVLANAKLKGRLTCLYNGGLAGDTTAMLLNRINSGEFEPYRGKAKFACLKIGVNDAATGADWTTVTKPNLDKIIAYCTGFAEMLVLHTNTPYGFNTTIAKSAAKIANYIRTTSATLQSCVLVDTYNLFVDKTATTGGILAAYGRSSESPNYMHPNSLGAAAEADLLVTVLSPLVVGDPIVFCNQANTVANWATDASQVLPNPLLVTNGGALSGNVTSAGAGGLAGAPLDWTVRETGAAGITVGTCQLVARSDGRGNNARVIAAAGIVAGLPIYELLTGTHHTEVSDGMVVQGEVTFSTLTFANMTSVAIYLAITDGNGSRNEYILGHDTDVASLNNLSDAVFKSKPISLKAPITGLRLRVDVRGVNKDFTGQMDFGTPVINILPNF